MSSRKRLALLVLVVSCAASLGAGRAAAASRNHPKVEAPVGVRAVEFARHLLGVRYTWGGTSPRTGFDCSGFVRYVYARFGISLPHSSYADFDLGRRVARLKPGDLVFFHGLGHVGLYVGHGKFIHAPHSGTHVSYSTLAAYRGSYDGARRIAHA